MNFPETLKEKWKKAKFIISYNLYKQNNPLISSVLTQGIAVAVLMGQLGDYNLP